MKVHGEENRPKPTDVSVAATALAAATDSHVCPGQHHHHPHRPSGAALCGGRHRNHTERVPDRDDRSLRPGRNRCPHARIRLPDTYPGATDPGFTDPDTTTKTPPGPSSQITLKITAGSERRACAPLPRPHSLIHFSLAGRSYCRALSRWSEPGCNPDQPRCDQSA